MRFGNRSQLLGVSLFALMSVSAASDAALLNMNGIFHKRQDGTAGSSSGVVSSAAPTSVAPSTPTAAESTPPVVSTPAPSSAAPTSDVAPSSNNDDSSSTAESTQGSASAPSSAATSERSTADDSSTVFSTTFLPLVSTRVQQFTTVTLVTSGDQTFSSTIVGENTEAITTGSVASVATLSGPSGNNNGSGGLSSSSQKIIGGVVGGVGGLLLIGAVVLFFLRQRKKNQTKVEFDEYDANNLAHQEKAPNTNNPFQTTLDQYHAPQARPNAAANF